MNDRNRKRIEDAILAGNATLDQMEELGAEAVLALKSDPEAGQIRCYAEKEPEQVDDRTFRFTMSTERPDDGVGDILKGWDLAQFKRNPVALWAHNGSSRPPIGTWGKLGRDTVKGFKSLEGDLAFASEGVDPFIDTLHALTADKVLRAVSVGVRFMKTKPIASPEEREALGLGPYGILSTKTKLLECSLVSIGMHGDALRKSLDDLLTREVVTRAGAEDVLKACKLTERDYADAVRELCSEAFNIPLDLDMKDQAIEFPASPSLNSVFSMTDNEGNLQSWQFSEQSTGGEPVWTQLDLTQTTPPAIFEPLPWTTTYNFPTVDTKAEERAQKAEERAVNLTEKVIELTEALAELSGRVSELADGIINDREEKSHANSSDLDSARSSDDDDVANDLLSELKDFQEDWAKKHAAKS